MSEISESTQYLIFTAIYVMLILPLVGLFVCGLSNLGMDNDQN